MRELTSTVATLMDDPGSRVGKTRRPLFRIYEIHSAILAGGYPNCSELGARLKVTRKTIQRDITFMRDELRLPVIYRDDLHGFCYEEDVTDFPIFQTTADELAGLFLARVALESVRGTRLADVMRNVFAKLTRGLEGRVSLQGGSPEILSDRYPSGI